MLPRATSILAVLTIVAAQTIVFPPWNGSDDLVLFGDVSISADVLQLTAQRDAEVGRVMFKSPILASRFSSSYIFVMPKTLTEDYAGDGMAFVMAEDITSVTQLSSLDFAADEAHGFLGLNSNVVVAVRFYPWKDTTFSDADSNHIAIHVTSIHSGVSTSARKLWERHQICLSTGTIIRSWVDYDSHNNTLQVFASMTPTPLKPANPILVYPIDLGKRSLYFGFAGLSGKSYALHTHRLLSWELTASNASVELPTSTVNSEIYGIAGANKTVSTGILRAAVSTGVSGILRIIGFTGAAIWTGVSGILRIIGGAISMGFSGILKIIGFAGSVITTIVSGILRIIGFTGTAIWTVVSRILRIIGVAISRGFAEILEIIGFAGSVITTIVSGILRIIGFTGTATWTVVSRILRIIGVAISRGFAEILEIIGFAGRLPVVIVVITLRIIALAGAGIAGFALAIVKITAVAVAGISSFALLVWRGYGVYKEIKKEIEGEGETERNQINNVVLVNGNVVMVNPPAKSPLLRG